MRNRVRNTWAMPSRQAVAPTYRILERLRATLAMAADDLHTVCLVGPIAAPKP